MKFKRLEIKDVFLGCFLAGDKGPRALLLVKCKCRFSSKNLIITINGPRANISETKMAPS